MRILTAIFLVAIFTASLSAQHQHDANNTLSAEEVKSEHSLYHLDEEWTDHRGNAISLKHFEGEPVIVVMFYGNCTEVCPVLIQDSWRLYNGLDQSQQKLVNVLAVTFDTKNDTPEVLHEYAQQEQLNIPGWHFMTSDDSSVRSLAMMLGVQYSQTSDGHFAHSNLITVLDEKGKIAKRVEGLNQPMEEAAAEISSIISKEKLQ